MNFTIGSATGKVIGVYPPGIPGDFEIAGVWAPTSGVAPSLVLPIPTPGHSTFKDVPEGSVFWREAEIAAALHIAGGHADGTLGAVEKLDKVHALAMVVRALEALVE